MLHVCCHVQQHLQPLIELLRPLLLLLRDPAAAAAAAAAVVSSILILLLLLLQEMLQMRRAYRPQVCSCCVQVQLLRVIVHLNTKP